MLALAFVAHVAAVVVAVSGVRKVAEPAAVTAALSAARLPARRELGRLLGATEIVVGAAVLVWGGALPAAMLAALYLGFLVFIGANRLRGLDVPCGCLGESTTPPGSVHVAVDAVAAVAATVAVWLPVGPATEWLDHGVVGAVALGGVVAAAALVIVGLEAASRSKVR